MRHRMEIKMDEVVSVLIPKELFNALMIYLGTQPYNDVAGLVNGFAQGQGFTAEQLEALEPPKEVEA